MPVPPADVTILPVRGLPEVGAGDDLAGLVAAACRSTGVGLRAGDLVVVSSKVVSKALGLWRPAREAAVEESTVRVVAERATPDGRVTRVVEAVAGPVMAAGGVDASNTGGSVGVLLLPTHPDAAATRLLARLLEVTGLPPGSLGVVVSDTAGRPWRSGQTDFALGAAGIMVLDDLRGAADADGRELSVTARALADEVAAAADLVKGKSSAVPVAVVRGLAHLVLSDPAVDVIRPGPGGAGDLPADGGSTDSGPSGARSLVRTGPDDWFRMGHVDAVRAALGVEPGSPESEAAGLPTTAPEPADERVRRAVRVATGALPGIQVEALEPAAPIGRWAPRRVRPPGAGSPDRTLGSEPGAPGLAPSPARREEPGVVSLVVEAPDDVVLGAFLARLDVALWAEDLRLGHPVLGTASALVEVLPRPT